MKIAQASTVGLIGMALLVGTAAVGCGSDDKESSSSSSSSSASSSSTAAATTSAADSEDTSAPANPAASTDDYSKLLLKASDIDPSFTAGEPILNPSGVNGIVQTMTNAGQNQTIIFSIVVAEDPAAAVKGLDTSKEGLPKEVDGAPQPADVGDGGIIATGKSPDGSKAITEVYFTQGKALVNVEFSSNPNDPILPETALTIAKMQDTQIKNNLA